MIRIGDVVRASETDFRLVECFDASTNACTLTPDCRLKHLFDAALRGYFQALDGATLADLTSGSPGPENLAEGPPGRGKHAVAVTMPTSTRPLRQAKAPARG
jgi:Rrf2 family nitric oxide-sensitive transcriptional repressor